MDSQLTKRDVKAAAKVGDLATLKAALGVKDARVRRAATKALESIGTPEAVDVLAIWAETATDPEVQAPAAGALTRLGDPRAGAANHRNLWLQGLVKEEWPASRSKESAKDGPQVGGAAPGPGDRPAEAAPGRAPGRRLEDSELNRLAAVVADGSQSRDARSEAINALVGARDPQGVPVLMAALTDEGVLIASRAAAGLGKLGDRNAVPPLTDALRRDQRPLVRKAAAQALGQLGGPESEPPLSQAADADTDPRVRAEATSALETAQRAGHLEAVLCSSDEVHQIESVHELMRLGHDVAAPRLLEAAQRVPARSQALVEIAYALDEIGRPATSDCLEALLCAGVQLSVARTLDILTDPWLRWAFAKELRSDEHPAFVLHDVPGKPPAPQPGTSLVVTQDRLLVHRTGTRTTVEIDEVERSVPTVTSLPYEQLTEVVIHFPEEAKSVSSGETLAAGLLGGALLGGVALSILDSKRRTEADPWPHIALRTKDTEIVLAGNSFLLHGTGFARWLHKRLSDVTP